MMEQRLGLNRDRFGEHVHKSKYKTMKRKTFIENLREQLEKIKAYKVSKATGVTYKQALAKIKSKEQN